MGANHRSCQKRKIRLLASFGRVFPQFFQKPQQCQPFIFGKDVGNIFDRGCVLTKPLGNYRVYCVFFETRATNSSNLESKSFRIGDLFDFL